MSVLADVTERLRQGLDVEVASDGGGLYATAPARPEYYELPEAAWGEGHPPHLMTRHAAMIALGLSWQGFRRWLRAGKLRAVETGGKRLYDVRPHLAEPSGPRIVAGVLCGKHESYRVEHIAHRPGGDLDVVVSATPHDHRAATYLAFRRDSGVWRPLAGRDRDLESAVARAEHETRYAGWDSPELVTLLDTLEAS